MSQIKFFEYKIKEVGKDWESIPRAGFLETTRKSAIIFDLLLLFEDGTEVYCASNCVQLL